MNNTLKLLSLAVAFCGAAACSSSDGGTTGSSTGAAVTSTGTSGGTTTGGTTTGGTTTGGSTTGAPGPSTFPCVDGGGPYMPTNPPASLPFCWCNPDKATGPQAYYQLINGCPPPGSTPDLSIPLPPPLGAENITGLATANLPLFVDAGIPGQ